MPKTSTTQARAICPACFAQQALRGEALVAHGYRRPQHWHQNVNTCSGTGHPHFGTPAGRDATARFAANLRGHVPTVLADAALVEAGTGTVLASKYLGGGVRTLVPVEDPTTELRARYAASLRQQAQALVADATELEAKVAAWTPQAPVTVAVEAKVSYLHWRTPRWFRGQGKACAGSYAGAHKGDSTVQAANVTCPKCLALIARDAGEVAR
jgi:hypothetical protein